MAEPFILRDYKGAARYLAYGDYKRAIPVLAFKSGIPGFLEKSALKFQRFLPRNRRFPSPQWKETITRLEKSLSEKVVSCLLYDTSWYKETLWIGSVTTEKASYFIKIFRQMDDCLFEQHQHQFIKEHFSGAFITVPVSSARDVFLLTPIIPRLRDVEAHDFIDGKLFHLNEQFIEKSGTFKRPVDIMPIDLYAMTYGSRYYEAIKKFGQWAENQIDNVVLVPIHGDMTPWNMFVDPGEKIVLVDYERAGWHVAYYDLFHYILQPLALKPAFTPLKTILAKYSWYNHDTMHRNLFLYLLDQLYFDLNSHLKKGHNHRNLHRLISAKILWLEELYHAG